MQENLQNKRSIRSAGERLKVVYRLSEVNVLQSTYKGLLHEVMWGSGKHNPGKGSICYVKRNFRVCCNKAKELIAAPSCSAEAKEAAQRGFRGGSGERTKTAGKRQRNSSLRWRSIIPIDGLIAFTKESDAGTKYSAERKKPKCSRARKRGIRGSRSKIL